MYSIAKPVFRAVMKVDTLPEFLVSHFGVCVNMTTVFQLVKNKIAGLFNFEKVNTCGSGKEGGFMDVIRSHKPPSQSKKVC